MYEHELVNLLGSSVLDVLAVSLSLVELNSDSDNSYLSLQILLDRVRRVYQMPTRPQCSIEKNLAFNC